MLLSHNHIFMVHAIIKFQILSELSHTFYSPFVALPKYVSVPSQHSILKFDITCYLCLLLRYQCSYTNTRNAPVVTLAPGIKMTLFICSPVFTSVQ